MILRLSLMLATAGALVAPVSAARSTEAAAAPATTSTAPCEMRPIHSLPGRGHVWGSVQRDCVAR